MILLVPRPSNTDQRRDEIAAGLARVMARSGYDGASVVAIAAEAGVASGGVHYHFESKADILLHLVGGLVRTVEQRVEDREARAASGRARLAAILDGLLALDRDADPGAVAVWALVGAEAVRAPDVREVYSAWIARATDRLKEAFVQACREEQRKATGAAASAASLIALVEGYYTLSATTSLIPAGSAAPTARRIAGALLDGQSPSRPWSAATRFRVG